MRSVARERLAPRCLGVAAPRRLPLQIPANEREEHKARAKKHPYRGTYFDFLLYKERAADNYAPSTPSVPHFFALDRQLSDIINGEAGNDTLRFVVRDNLTGSPCTGLIRLGGQTFTVLQEGALGGADCPKTLSPT